CKESNQRKQLWGQRCQDVTTFESFGVVRPLECPPLCVGWLGTRTHCHIAPSNPVVRHSSLPPRFARTQGPFQPIASLRAALSEALHLAAEFVSHPIHPSSGTQCR